MDQALPRPRQDAEPDGQAAGGVDGGHFLVDAVKPAAGGVDAVRLAQVIAAPLFEPSQQAGFVPGPPFRQLTQEIPGRMAEMLGGEAAEAAAEPNHVGFAVQVLEGAMGVVRQGVR